MLICTNAGKEMIGSFFQFSIVHEEGSNCENIFEMLFGKGERIENTYSRFLDNNELSKLNSMIGKWVSVSAELFKLIKFGNDIRINTDGAFNITVKSILDALGYDKKYSFAKHGSGAIGEIEFDEENLKIKISAEIDLGGFGKGYAIDQMSSILIKNGVEKFCINGGGDIFCKGTDEKGGGWKVHFGHPINRDEAIGFVIVDNFACASSNPNMRTWDEGRHHLIDPLTGAPAVDMLGVYVQAPETIVADAYATALFVMGYDRAKKWLQQNSSKESVGGHTAAHMPIEAMIIGPTGKVYKSENFKGELFS